ncbi:hypothetical protein N0V83_010002 [Neocucurbitaria cava]|uniref:Uncharacterized protein n=1 Tax=Neocucurbitaria cava TaxID=798079 RepID=A0A9W8XYB4_9PLEO|nr:hypothetical protein N0V83_010002 [Neocucurbitaria cava]
MYIGALDHDKDTSQSPNHVEPKPSNNNGAKMLIVGSSNADSASHAKPLSEFLASLKKPADGKYFRCLCVDGVFRILIWLPTPPDQPTGVAVYDGLPMSSDLIKAYLDRKPWTKTTEDRFRGVDGRNVPQEQWLQPGPGVLPSMGSKHEREEEKRQLQEERRILEEKISRGEMSYGPACGSVQSDYDLRPR